MKDIYILGIESSCDETSMAIVKNGREVVSLSITTQMDTHAKFGGVVPEIASRMHTEALTFVLEDCLEKANMKIEDMDAIAVTYAPGLTGSLMVGVEAAKILSYMYQKPLIAVNHLIGHIYANNLESKMEFPLLALVVSGGHTELLVMEDDYKFKRLGETMDDAIGEAFDKVARVMGLPYPGGPKLDKLSKEGKPTYKLPIPLNDDSYNFSFSGLKSAVINLNHNEEQKGKEINKADLAASFQKVAVTSIVSKTKKALKDYNINNLIVAGGVAANSILRDALTDMCNENNIHLSIPPLKYCTDNAAMIASAGYYAYKLGRRADYHLNSLSTTSLQ